MNADLQNYIRTDFKPINSLETVAQATHFFDSVGYSHFPVVDDGVYIGSIASDDIETFDFDKKVNEYRYGLEPFFVRKSQIWLDVLEVFAKNQTNLVPILDENNLYSGYYELGDVLQFFSETPFLKEQGRVVVIQKETIDYSMSQISQIVESNNGKILGIFVSSADSSNLQITIKISSGSINEIIQTFRRYNYQIISNHQEDTYLSGLKERSEYLEKYLNI